MKILVIRFKQIGYAVLSSVICNTLKKTFPDFEIDYVLYEHICPLFQSYKSIKALITPEYIITKVKEIYTKFCKKT